MGALLWLFWILGSVPVPQREKKLGCADGEDFDVVSQLLWQRRSAVGVNNLRFRSFLLHQNVEQLVLVVNLNHKLFVISARIIIFFCIGNDVIYSTRHVNPTTGDFTA